jgi:Putative transposase
VAIIQRFGAALNLNVHALVLDGVYAEDGFHAAVVVPGRDRARLERVCRYALRPPVAHDRIRLTEQPTGAPRAAAPLGRRNEPSALRSD